VSLGYLHRQAITHTYLSRERVELQRVGRIQTFRERGEGGEMGGDHGKLMKSLKGAAQKYLGVGFLLGFFLVLLTYFTVSEQFAIAAPNGEFHLVHD
jgi:hypothetical protein